MSVVRPPAGAAATARGSSAWRSLRVRLVLVCVGLSAAGLTLCSGSIYVVVARDLQTHFDQVLVAQARTIAALVEYDARRGGYEFMGRDLLAAEGDALRTAVRDPAGVVLAASAGTVPDDPAWPAAGVDSSHSWSWTTGGERWRTVACSLPCARDDEDHSGAPTPIVDIRVARRSAGTDERIAHVALLLTAMTVGLSVVLGVALGWGIGRVLRPLDHLAARLARWDAGGADGLLPVPVHPAELVPVVTTLNQLLTRIAESLARERAAGSAIAHEVRTPLAGLRAVIEVALSRERSAADGRAALGECLEMATNLQRMVESLLLLTRLEQGRVPLLPVAIDLQPHLRARWEPFVARAAQRGLRVAWSGGDGCPLRIDADLLDIVVRNLFDNAADHTDRDGLVVISTALRHGRALLTVGNTCSGLTAADLDRVFTRFWRGDRARAVDDRHCGLGLCLARDLARVLGGELTAMLHDGTFTVSLSLPCSPGAHAPLTDAALDHAQPVDPRHPEPT